MVRSLEYEHRNFNLAPGQEYGDMVRSPDELTRTVMFTIEHPDHKKLEHKKRAGRTILALAHNEDQNCEDPRC